MEAHAGGVKYSLGERSFHAEDKTVVEFGRIVAAVLVDHEGPGNRTELQQAMPILVRARQARRFQGEDRPDRPIATLPPES